jgi:uncharacterized lipoprotein YajG
MNKIIRLLIVIVSMLIITGCDSKPQITADTAPFEKAIATYCRNHNYGMKVKEFVSLNINNEQANAVAKMEEAGGTYGISVKWEFKLKKQNGSWRVSSHDAK